MITKMTYLILCAVILTSLVVQPTCGQIILNSTLNVGHLQGGDSINFTCITKGSQSLAWSSNDYVGRNGETLTFASLHVGQTRTANSYTYARLLSTSMDNSQTVLVSQLYIIVQPNFTISTVVCHSLGTNDMENIAFDLSANPDLKHEEQLVCPGDTRTFTCKIWGSRSLVWESAEYIGSRLQFNSSDEVGTIRPNENTEVGATATVTANLTVNKNLNGVSILESELTITVVDSILTDREKRHYFTCLNIDLEAESIVSLVADMARCGEPNAITTTTGSNNIGRENIKETDNNSLYITIGVFAGVLVIICTIFIILLVAVVLHYRAKLYSKQKPNFKAEKQQNVELSEKKAW